MLTSRSSNSYPFLLRQVFNVVFYCIINNMKILLVSSYLPYPLHSGGQVRLYNLIKELSAKHEITLICEKRSHQTAEDISEMAKICKKVITVPRRKQWS